jgi:hypothetical protein
VVTMAYEPDEEEQKNYSTSSAVTDGQERIYYTNDSGHVFAIQMSKKTISPEGEGIPPTGETRNLMFAGLLLVTLAVGFVYAANKKRQATVSDD